MGNDVDWYRRVAETIRAHLGERGPDGRPFYAPPPDSPPERLGRPRRVVRIARGVRRRFHPDGTWTDEPAVRN